MIRKSILTSLFHIYIYSFLAAIVKEKHTSKRTLKEQIEEQTLKNLKLDNNSLENLIKKDEKNLERIENENILLKSKLLYYSLI